MNNKILTGFAVLAVAGGSAYYFSGDQKASQQPVEESSQINENKIDKGAAAVTTEENWLQETNIPDQPASAMAEKKKAAQAKGNTTGSVLDTYPEEVRENVFNIAKNSGVKDRLSTLTDAMEQQLGMIFESQEFDPSIQEEMNKLIREEFNGEKLMDEYLKNVAEKFSPEELANLNKMYEDPAMSEFVERGAQLSDPANVQEITAAYENYMQNSDKDPEILAQASKLDEQLGYSKQMTRILKEVTQGAGGTEFTPEVEADVNKLVAQQMQSAIGFQMKDMSASSREQAVQVSSNPNAGALNGIMTDVVTGPVKKMVQMVSEKENAANKDENAE